MILTRRAWTCASLAALAAPGLGTALLLAPNARAEQLHSLGEAVVVTPPRPLALDGLTDLDGRAVAASQFAGRILVLNFWATWCPPCVQEMPALDRLAAQNPDIAVLAASSDRGGADTVRPFLTAQTISHLIPLLDHKGAVGRSLGVAGFPATLIADQRGQLRAVMSGPVAWDMEAAKIRALCG